MSLSGGKLAGGNPENERIENDFYATDPASVRALLEACPSLFIGGEDVLEPCCGNGNISKTVKELYPTVNVDNYDIADRGYHENFKQCDFLAENVEKKYDIVITNPPYSLAQEFVEKSLDCLKDGGICAMFLKIQFLEGEKRKKFFEKNPPVKIFVFSKRQATWSDGLPLNPATGKRWATTMCFAWYVWVKGNKDNPIIEWL